MLEAVKKLFDRKQKPPYQAGTNLLLLLVLSVVIGSGVSYATLGFMKAFDHVVNWVYFDWNDSPSGRYTHKVDARNKLSLDFRGNNAHDLDSLKQTKWPTAGDCIIITTRNGVRQTPVTGQWKFEDDQVSVDIDGQPIELKFDGKNLTPIAADANATQLATHLPGPEPTHAIRFDYKQGSFTDVPKWHIFVALIGGGLFIGMLYIAFKLPRGHGPADAIISRINNDGIMPIREGISTALVCISSIGLGASVGRYGPAVHLGATLGSGFGQAFKLGRTNTVTFLGCGIASAIATSFNTPIAAVIFYP
ncbi:chloride channel protein [Verrucomicrobia bacterium]|nr:chloride channel protein [Verrucomicrobiota bacterium]